MSYKVQLLYFRQTGKFLLSTETVIAIDGLVEIWEAVDDMRRLGRLPGLRLGAGRDLFIVVDVPDHPQRVPHMVTPPFLDDDDVTPPRVSTGEMIPLVRVPLDELPRTSTRDVLKVPPSALAEPAPLSPPDPEADTVVVTHDDDITPVEHHFPKPPKKS